MDESPRCCACGGPYHPASGDYDRKTGAARCGRCYREFLAWWRGHSRRRWGGADFYAAAATSIRAANIPSETETQTQETKPWLSTST